MSLSSCFSYTSGSHNERC